MTNLPDERLVKALAEFENAVEDLIVERETPVHGGFHASPISIASYKNTINEKRQFIFDLVEDLIKGKER